VTIRLPHGTQHRATVFCPACRRPVAYIRREWLVLRRLLLEDTATAPTRTATTITIRCQCGHETIVHWSAIQM
jgi:hypothetical protein